MTGISQKPPAQKRGARAAEGNREKTAAREQVVPVMLRPKASQKACVEHIAQQMEVKRSQLDPTFYLRGALLTAVENLGKEEMIGTWTRKEVAAALKSAFVPLFELLYEQDELPLVFTLLIGREVAPAVIQSQVYAMAASLSQKSESIRPGPPAVREPPAEEVRFPSLSADAEIGLTGFPDVI